MQHAAEQKTGARAGRALARLLVAIVAIFLAPALASAAWWASIDRPTSWRQADWSASGILPAAEDSAAPAIYIMAARTGGMKGAFATHSWIVTKEAGGDYRRYDKVGWGRPVRIDGYPADARWYSNLPEIVGSAHGAEAERLIPEVEAAIAAYPHNGEAGDPGYRIYPGPNSNSFVAHVLHDVPELGIVLPPNAVGRDYLSGGRFFAVADDGLNVHATFYGLAGFSAGIRSGIEIHLMGLVAGIDFRRIGIKVPAFGLVSVL